MIVSPGGAYRDDRKCPDGGRCSHLCPDEAGCWRVSFCAPFTAHGGDWTPEERAAGPPDGGDLIRMLVNQVLGREFDGPEEWQHIWDRIRIEVDDIVAAGMGVDVPGEVGPDDGGLYARLHHTNDVKDTP